MCVCVRPHLLAIFPIRWRKVQAVNLKISTVERQQHNASFETLHNFMHMTRAKQKHTNFSDRAKKNRDCNRFPLVLRCTILECCILFGSIDSEQVFGFILIRNTKKTLPLDFLRCKPKQQNDHMESDLACGHDGSSTSSHSANIFHQLYIFSCLHRKTLRLCYRVPLENRSFSFHFGLLHAWLFICTHLRTSISTLNRSLLSSVPTPPFKEPTHFWRNEVP